MVAHSPSQPVPMAQHGGAGSAARAARGRACVFQAHALPGQAGAEQHQCCHRHLLHAVYHYPLFMHLRPSFHPPAGQPASSPPHLPCGEPRAKGRSSPGTCGEWALWGHAAAMSLFFWDQTLPGPITMDKPAAIVWGENWGHRCHCWSITEPLQSHKSLDLNAQWVPQQGTCPASAEPGDPSGQGGRPVAPAEPRARLQWAGGWCPCLPCLWGSCPAAPTIINLVRPWQLRLSLIDSVGAEVLGHAGPAASPTSSAVLGKQVPGTALCCQAGRHQGQGWLQLCPGPMWAPWSTRGAGGTLLPGKAPSGLSGRGRRGMHIQAMLFISPDFTPQTGLSSTMETQRGSDLGHGAAASCPGPPLCLWLGSGDRAVTQGRASAHTDVGGISWLLLGGCLHHGWGLRPLGTRGCPGMGTCRAQGYCPAQLPAGMPGWAHPGYLHARLKCSAPSGAAFLWHRGGLSPGAEHPWPQPGCSRDLRGSAPVGHFISRPHRTSLQGGGRLPWHDLLALPLSAWGRNHVGLRALLHNCTKPGRIRPSHSHAMRMVTTCPGSMLAGPCLPFLGRVDLLINNRGTPVPVGSGAGSILQLWTCVLLTLSAHSTRVQGWGLPCHHTHPCPLSFAHPLVGRVLSPPEQSAGPCQQTEALGRTVPGMHGTLQSALQQGFKLCTELP